MAMERAGHAVALAAARVGAGYGKQVVVLAGPGNNGGDGYVAARYLRARGAHVVIHALAPPATDLARAAEVAARRAGIRIVSLGEVVGADVVIDALFGGGVREGLPESVARWMGHPGPIIAVDFPTGLDPDTGKVAETAFHASETVTFGAVKTGHVLGAGPDHCGRLTVVDIGISGGEPSLYIAEEADAPRPGRARKAHKWSAGSVLLVGGSEGMTGAIAFAGRAALAFGAGSVMVATSALGIVQEIAPELPALPIETAQRHVSRFDVVVAGPGLAEHDVPQMREVLAGADRVLLDAGAVTPETLETVKQGGGQVIVTPHDAEFARVAGVGAGTYAIRSFAQNEGIVVLRKGNPTMVTDGGMPVLVTTGGPELASIGTGDVLAGMVAALWARGLEPMQAAISGAYWHGVAGARLAAVGSVTARGLLDEIGRHAW